MYQESTERSHNSGETLSSPIDMKDSDSMSSCILDSDLPPTCSRDVSSDELMERDEMSPRKKFKGKTDRHCGVCGDKALGYNFNAVTCESCKAFFRRNALKDKISKCLFQGKCVIDIRTRRFCPSCRIEKCFNIGMKKDMILDESERQARLAKVLENRQKRHMKLQHHHIKEEIKEDDQYQESTCTSSNMFSPNTAPLHIDMPVTSSCVSVNTLVTSPVGIIRSEVRLTPKRDLPTDPSLYRHLSLEEVMVLNELNESYDTTLGQFCTEDAQPEIFEEDGYNTVNDLVNNSEAAVRRLIKFVKRLDDFRKLLQEDQIAALKACVLHTLLLRSVVFYVVEKDAWITPKGEIPTSILKKATGYVELHDSHTRYCRSLKTIVGEDNTLMALIQVLSIFSPEGQHLKQRDVVSDIQDKYLTLLKHYLESEFTFEFARYYYFALLQIMAELRTLSDDHARILLHVNPSEIEPLMLEIFNLK